MKKIFLLLITCILCCTGFAQIHWNKIFSYNEYLGLRADSVMEPAHDTLASAPIGSIATLNNHAYQKNSSGHWFQTDGGGSGLSQIFGKYPVQISGTDTAYVDTTSGVGLATKTYVTGNFYPRFSNPAGYLTSNGLPNVINSLQVVNYGNSPGILSGTLLSRPSPGITGRIYVSTDSKEIYRDTGSGWDLIGTSSAIDSVFIKYHGNVGDTLLWAVGTDTIHSRKLRDSLGFHHIVAPDSAFVFYTDASTTWSGVVGGSSATSSNLTIPNSGAGVQYVLNGTTSRTFTLPTFSGNGNRAFFFKNASTATLTIARAGTDTIYTSSKVASFTLAPGQSGFVISSPFYWYAYLNTGGGGVGSLDQVTQSGNITRNSLRLSNGIDTTIYYGAFGSFLDGHTDQAMLQLLDGTNNSFPAHLTNYYVDSITYRGNNLWFPQGHPAEDTLATRSDLRTALDTVYVANAPSGGSALPILFASADTVYGKKLANGLDISFVQNNDSSIKANLDTTKVILNQTGYIQPSSGFNVQQGIFSGTGNSIITVNEQNTSVVSGLNFKQQGVNKGFPWFYEQDNSGYTNMQGNFGYGGGHGDASFYVNRVSGRLHSGTSGDDPTSYRTFNYTPGKYSDTSSIKYLFREQFRGADVFRLDTANKIFWAGVTPVAGAGDSVLGWNPATKLIEIIPRFSGSGGGGGGGGNNIYNIDSTLASNRTVTMSGRFLKFLGGQTYADTLNVNKLFSIAAAALPTGATTDSILVTNGTQVKAIDQRTAGVTIGTVVSRLALSPVQGQKYYQTDEKQGLYTYTGSKWTYQPDINAFIRTEGFASNLVSAYQFSTSFTGTGASANTGGSDGTGLSNSVIALQTGTTTTGHAQFFDNTTSTWWQDKEFVEYRVRLVQNLGNATDTAKLQLGGYTFIDGVYFLLDPGVNGGRWQCVTQSGTATATDSGISPDLNYHTFGIYYGASNSIKFYIDHVLVATNTTNIPSGTWSYGVAAEVLKRAGTTGMLVYVDYVQQYTYAGY